ncbi:response regulator [Marinibaculum pumilum]|uniref:Response regulator n=1 Tax=Marinibaculum pumilum TaxID=1766165 RepID=A0ABV7L878_9PROT
MPAKGGPGTPLRILLAEDNEMNLKVMQAFLSRPGFSTAVAMDGAAAVEAVAGGAFDVVLMDLRMPGVDGFEAARRIRALSGPQRGVRIIALSADVTGDVVRRCREAGMDDYLAKPVRLAVLDDRLAAIPRRAAAGGPDLEAQRA